MADDAGPLLARAGLIENEQLSIARQAQSAQGGTIGEHLVLNGFIDDEELTSFYRTRLMVPRVDPKQLDAIANAVLARVPKDMAAEFRVVPVAVDREQNLIVAMSDPSNTHAVDEISFFTGTYVVRAVASQREIATALKKHYDFDTPLTTSPGDAVAQDVQRRRALPPMTSPPDAAQRAVRISEIVPAIRDAKAAEAAAMDRGRAGLPSAPVGGPPPPAPAPPHQRKTLQQPIAPQDKSEADTRPIMRAIDIERVRRSSEQPKMAAGEVDAASAQDRALSDKLPAVVVSDDALAQRRPPPTSPPVASPQSRTVIEPIHDEASEPIILDPKTARPPTQEPAPAAAARAGAKIQIETEAPDPPDESPDDEIVVLSNVKGKRRRRQPSATRLGVGELGVTAGSIPGLTPIRHESSDGTPLPVATERGPASDSHTQMLTAIPVKDDASGLEGAPDPERGPTERAASAPPATRTRARRRHGSKPVEVAPTAPEPPPASKTVQMGSVAPSDVGPRAAPEAVPTEHEFEQTGRFDRTDSTLMTSVDDGWGEPGSTIPPPYLGAIADQVSSPLGIPVPDPEGPGAPNEPNKPDEPDEPDTVPEPDTPPSPTAAATPALLDPTDDDLPSHKQSAAIRSERTSAQRGAASYDAAVRRLSGAMKRLEQATTRDDVIGELVKFLSSVCKRAAFFAVKRGELHGWAAAGQGVVSERVDRAHLPLDLPSTFQDIVATRLPFHGPLHDAVSRDFLLGAIGTTPTDMTALPITVRDKVVGILYGDERRHTVFDDHLNTLSRSAGAALERILVERKTRPPI